jgi:hypothetical protein
LTGIAKNPTPQKADVYRRSIRKNHLPNTFKRQITQAAQP